MKGKKVIGDDTEYRKAAGFNNSLLNDFAGGLTKLREYLNVGLSPKEIEDKANKACFRKGSALDVMLTQSMQDFNQQFVILPVFNETAQEAILLKAWIEAGNTEWDAERMEEFAKTVEYTDAKKAKKTGLWGNIKDTEKRIAKFNTPFWKTVIFPYLRSFKDKTYLTVSEYQEVLAGAEKLRKDAYLSKIIEPQEDEILYTQLMIFQELEFKSLKGLITEEIRGVRVDEQGRVWCMLKGLLDYVTVNTKEKWVQPRDLKSSSKPIGENFQDSMPNYGYVGQDSMYSYLVEKWVEENYPGYEIRPFQFVVSSLTEKDEPALSFELPNGVRAIGKHGGSMAWESEGRTKRKYFKGWIRLIEELVLQFNTGQLHLTPKQMEAKKLNEPQRPEYMTYPDKTDPKKADILEYDPLKDSTFDLNL